MPVVGGVREREKRVRMPRVAPRRCVRRVRASWPCTWTTERSCGAARRRRRRRCIEGFQQSLATELAHSISAHLNPSLLLSALLTSCCSLARITVVLVQRTLACTQTKLARDTLHRPIAAPALARYQRPTLYCIISLFCSANRSISAGRGLLAGSTSLKQLTLARGVKAPWATNPAPLAPLNPGA